MIKAWQNKEDKTDIRFDPQHKSVADCFEPVAITPWEKHEEVQAALAAAEEALEYSRKRIAGKKQHDVIDEALVKIRRSNG